jgi:hypothetical protein
MICPSCSSSRVFHSRAKSLRDRALKRLVPVVFYRCHACGWRRAKVKGGGVKAVLLHALSLIGYVGSVGLVIALAAGLIMIILSFLGIPVPW